MLTKNTWAKAQVKWLFNGAQACGIWHHVQV